MICLMSDKCLGINMVQFQWHAPQRLHSRTTYNFLNQCSYLIFTWIQLNFAQIVCELMFERCFHTLFPPIIGTRQQCLLVLIFLAAELDIDSDKASTLPAYVIHTRHRLRAIKTVWTVHLSEKQKVASYNSRIAKDRKSQWYAYKVNLVCITHYVIG